MIRFRNPGTQFSTQVQVIKELYKELGDYEYFTLSDMALVIAQSRLMTAYGYAGDEAIKLSNTEQESMNSAKMNAKMYAEVFRMLGWVTPYSEKSSYPLVFTYLGVHIALATGDCSKLYEQCVLGINNPTQLTRNLHYNEKTRFFKCALKTFIDLGGIMYKHELCLGPMSINDENESEYSHMVSQITRMRGNINELKRKFQALADSLNMGTVPVDNCTRLPIALMKSCGWVESTMDKSLYGVSMSCLMITDYGRQVYNSIQNMYDLRLGTFLKQNIETQNALIRLGMYSMLQRADYDLEKVAGIMQKDREICFHLIGDKELLFSPCQTIRRPQVETALDISISGIKLSENKFDAFESLVDTRNQFKTYKLQLTKKENSLLDKLNSVEDFIFLQKVEEYKAKGFNNNEIASMLFSEYITATQAVFYPLIATLFRVIGFNCYFSRPGDNGARWDAIIEDGKQSIPIEIKSPTEEQHISIKAIRQALENKIVLLSRKTYKTEQDTTSLAVGYFMPNERAEVARMISDIKNTYGYKIGVIDLLTLLHLAVNVICDDVYLEKSQIYGLEGLVDADIF